MSDALTKLIETERERAYDRGLQEATSIRLGETSYGACHSAIVAVEFNGFLDLRNQIRGRRWRRYGDNPGQAYMGSCELIMIHRSDWHTAGRGTAVLLCSTSYDI